MRSTILLFLAVAASAELADGIHQLPQLDVSADIIAAMIPCEQVTDACNEANQHTDAFELSMLTVVKAPTSRFTKPIRCFIRAKDGHVLQEITNEALLFTLDPKWPKEGFLSSNQPDEYSYFYLTLRPKLGPGPVTLGAMDHLLSAYVTFSEKRLERTIRYYSARGSWSIDLRWATVPDEIVILTTHPTRAAAIAQKLDLRASGNAVRINSEKLAALKARLGADFALLESPADIDCVTPWRSFAGLPPVRDHAALIRLGWAEYAQTPGPGKRRDFIALGMEAAPVSAATASN